MEETQTTTKYYYIIPADQRRRTQYYYTDPADQRRHTLNRNGAYRYPTVDTAIDAVRDDCLAMDDYPVLSGWHTYDGTRVLWVYETDSDMYDDIDGISASWIVEGCYSDIEDATRISRAR